MTGHGGVAEHGFRPRRGDGQGFRFARLRIDDRIFDVPEMSLDFFVDDLVVGNRGLELAVPVDHPVAAIDEPVAEKPVESLAHGAGADGVHGEPLAFPVAGTAHSLLLADDPFPVFVLPGLDLGHKPFTAQIVPRLPFEFEEALLDDGLSADAGVVGSGHPERVVSHHPVPADEEVLHDVVHGVSHVEGAGDVGQGHHDDVTAGAAVGYGGETIGLAPFLVDRRFVDQVIVQLGQFFPHCPSSPLRRLSRTRPGIQHLFLSHRFPPGKQRGAVPQSKIKEERPVRGQTSRTRKLEKSKKNGRSSGTDQTVKTPSFMMTVPSTVMVGFLMMPSRWMGTLLVPL